MLSWRMITALVLVCGMNLLLWVLCFAPLWAVLPPVTSYAPAEVRHIALGYQRISSPEMDTVIEAELDAHPDQSLDIGWLATRSLDTIATSFCRMAREMAPHVEQQRHSKLQYIQNKVGWAGLEVSEPLSWMTTEPMCTHQSRYRRMHLEPGVACLDMQRTGLLIRMCQQPKDPCVTPFTRQYVTSTFPRARKMAVNVYQEQCDMYRRFATSGIKAQRLLGGSIAASVLAALIIAFSADVAGAMAVRKRFAVTVVLLGLSLGLMHYAATTFWGGLLRQSPWWQAEIVQMYPMGKFAWLSKDEMATAGCAAGIAIACFVCGGLAGVLCISMVLLPRGLPNFCSMSSCCLGRRSAGVATEAQREQILHDPPRGVVQTIYYALGVPHSVLPGAGLLDATVFLPVHLWRVMDDKGLTSCIAGKYEKATLSRCAPQITSVPVRNMLCWRRSMMVLCLWAAIIATPFSLMDVWKGVQVLEDQQAYSYWPRTFEDFQMRVDPHATFAVYAKTFVRRVASDSTHRLKWFQLLVSLFQSGFECVALLLVVFALKRWFVLKDSGRLVACAFAVVLLAPAIAVLVPARSLLVWGTSEVEVQTFITEAFDHFGPSRAVQVICGELGRYSFDDLERVHGELTNICHQVDRWPDTIGFGTADLKPLHRACDSIQDNILVEGRLDSVNHSATSMANQCELMAIRRNVTAGTLPTSALSDAVEKQGLSTAKIYEYFFGGTGLVHGILMFIVMLPSGLALAPGLAHGALKVKLLFPTTMLPGTFVVLLPWVYCPLSWTVYQLIAQPFADGVTLTLAILLLAFSPMLFCVVGLAYNITQPMTSSQVIHVTRIFTFGGLVLLATTLGLMYHWAETSSSSTVVLQYLLDHNDPLQLTLSLGSRWGFRYLVTSLVGLDLVAGEVSALHTHETFGRKAQELSREIASNGSGEQLDWLANSKHEMDHTLRVENTLVAVALKTQAAPTHGLATSDDGAGASALATQQQWTQWANGGGGHCPQYTEASHASASHDVRYWGTGAGSDMSHEWPYAHTSTGGVPQRL